MTSVFDVLTCRKPLKCAPVAQRIEHLPCWSLNGELCGTENPLSGRPCMRERPESLRYFDVTVQVTILEDWVIRRKPVSDGDPQRLNGSGL